MQTEEIRALVASLRAQTDETTCCEFKVNFQDPAKIGVLISALSNAACLEGERFGYVIWGVEDNSHALVGTTFNHRRKTDGNQELELWLAQMLKPSITFQFFEAKIDECRVVLLRIPASSSVSTKFKDIAYIRIGSATPKLSDYPEREAALTSALRPFAWEQGISLCGLRDEEVLNVIDFKGYFQLLRQEMPASNIDVLNRLQTEQIVIRGETRDRFDVTNFGAILFGSKLETFGNVTRKMVRVIQYEGRSRANTIKERDGVRGYAIGFEGLIKYISDQLPRAEKIEGGFRKSVPSYDEEMIREAIANALIHQDFAVSGTGPMVEIFKDRVEIYNPGRPLIDPSRFIDFPPRRNELLASMMRRVNICEERGSGVDKIISAAERLTLPAPDFRVDGENSRTFLFGPRPYRDTTATERVRACYQHAVMRFLQGERMTNATLRVRLGIDDKNAAQVSRIIGEALELRHIKQSDAWSTRAGTYVPIWA